MNASNIGDHYYQLSSLPIARKEWFSKYKNIIQQPHRENGKIVLSRILPNYQSSLRLTDVKVCEQHITKSTLIKIGHGWLYIKLKGILYKLVHKNSVIHLWIVFVQFKKREVSSFEKKINSNHEETFLSFYLFIFCVLFFNEWPLGFIFVATHILHRFMMTWKVNNYQNVLMIFDFFFTQPIKLATL